MVSWLIVQPLKTNKTKQKASRNNLTGNYTLTPAGCLECQKEQFFATSNITVSLGMETPSSAGTINYNISNMVVNFQNV